MFSTRMPRSGSSEREHRRHHRAAGGLAHEALAAADAVAAVDRDGLAGGVGEVAAAGGDEHDLLVGDAAQGRLGAGQPAAVAPRGEAGDVLVHRARQRGRAAVVAELALQVRELADGGAVAAELDGDGGPEQADVAQGVVRLGHEGAVAVVALGVRRRGWARSRARARRARRMSCVTGVVSDGGHAASIRAVVRAASSARSRPGRYRFGTTHRRPAGATMDAWQITGGTVLSRWPARSWPTGGPRSSCASSCSATRGSTTSHARCPGSPAPCSCSACGTSSATACSRRGPRRPGHGQRVPPHAGRPGPRAGHRQPRALGDRVALRRHGAARGRADDADVVDAPPGRPGSLPAAARRDRVAPHRARPETIWFVLEHGAVSVCMQHPGFDVDLVVTMATADLADVFQGYRRWQEAVDSGAIDVERSAAAGAACRPGSCGARGWMSRTRARTGR